MGTKNTLTDTGMMNYVRKVQRQGQIVCRGINESNKQDYVKVEIYVFYNLFTPTQLY